MKKLYKNNGFKQGNNIPCDTCKNKESCKCNECKNLHDYMIKNKELKVC